MFKKHKRILWLLNHRTLMPYEVPLMQRLGFEVFVPKLIPKSGFRSGLVDYSYDSSLSIPAKVLSRLNQFNFYEEEWPTDITEATNRYFGTAFTIPHARQCSEVVDNFEGQIVFRAFGLDSTQTYKRVLDELYGALLMRKLRGLGARFWFGEGYSNLHECEEAFFAERSLFLPIGAPDYLFRNAGQWKGTERKILFVCPNATTDPYYANLYRTFKSNFGDLPHVIVGAQDVPMDDPNVLGFILDERLANLYLDCAALYYPSTEPRHVHYSPVEAAIIGMPVVFFEGSLLDRMSNNVTHGRVASVSEARSVLVRILEGDSTLIDEIRNDQRELAFHFSDAYCAPEWTRQMQERAFLAAIQPRPALVTAMIETYRSLAKPWARGRISKDPHAKAIRPPRVGISAVEAKALHGSSLEDGIDFALSAYPAAVEYVDGVDASEGWGRWSIKEKVTVVLKHNIQGRLRLFVRARGYADNAGSQSLVRIGREVQPLRLPGDIADAVGSWLHFDVRNPTNIIEFSVPHPTRPPGASRLIGIGLIEVRAFAPVVQTVEEAKLKLGGSLLDGIDFSNPNFPSFVDRVEGVSAHEGWGRWSSGDQVRIELKHALHGRIRLLVRAVAYGPNVDVPIRVSIGERHEVMRLAPSLDAEQEISIGFELARPSNMICIRVPSPVQPPGDDRWIGIGLYRIRAIAG